MARDPAQSTPLFGRGEPLAALSSEWDRLSAGQGCLALISGEGGIGKTRLVEEFLATVQPAGVPWGRCYEGDGAPPFWPWIQVARELAGGSVAELPPALATLIDAAGSAKDGGPRFGGSDERFRLAQALDDLLRRRAQDKPLVIVLDDLHWADAGSLSLAEFIANQGCLRSSPVFLIATYRDAEPEAPAVVGESLVRLRRAPRVLELKLRGLSLPETADFATHLRGGAEAPDDAVRTLHTYTEGNPFVIGETVRTAGGALTVAAIEALPWRDGPLGPTSIRLSSLDPALRGLLEAAAVLGREFPTTLLTSVAGVSQEPLLELLDAAEEARVIQPVPGAPGRYRFVHALLRETLYGEMLAGKKQRLHFRAAEALEAMTRYEVDGNLPDLVRHFTFGAALGGGDRAVAYALQLGKRSLRGYAYESAAATYAQALTLRSTWPGDPAEVAELHIGHGESLRRMARRDDARAAFEQAAAIARRLLRDDGPQGPMLLGRAAFGYSRTGFGFAEPATIALLREAQAALEPLETPLRAMVMSSLAVAIGFGDQRAEAPILASRALRIARTSGDAWTLGFTLDAARCVITSSNRLEERIALSRELAALPDPEFAVLGRRWLVCDLIEAGDWPAVRHEIDAHAALAGKLRQPTHLWYAELFEAMAAAASGDYEAAERRSQAALGLGQASGSPDTMLFFAPMLLHLRREQGRGAELEPMLAMMETASAHLPAWREVLALLRAEAGRDEEARPLYEQMIANDCAALLDDNYWLLSMYVLSETCAELGDAANAPALYRLLSPFASRMVQAGNGVVVAAPVSQSLGLLALTEGRLDASAGHFRDALATADRWGAPAMRAHALAGLSRALMESDPAAARAAHGEACELATKHGLVRLNGLLQRHAPPTSPAATPGGLSAREAEVLGLLAAGWSNQRIADGLVLSLNTVIRHVSNIYGKIGASNRAEATAWALANGIRRD